MSLCIGTPVSMETTWNAIRQIISFRQGVKMLLAAFEVKAGERAIKDAF